MRKALGIFFLLLLVASANARKGKAASTEDIQIPTDFSVDLELGLAQHSRVVGNTPEAKDGPVVEIGRAVFDVLTRQPMVQGLGLPYNWKLTILADDVVNAHSGAFGEITVNGGNGGMATMLGDKPGLWAAVLSHEISHTAYRHAVRQLLYEASIAQQLNYYRIRAANGDKNADWSIIGLTIGSAIAEKKMGRDQEHEADLKGMMLMAQAGFHPDNAFALHHLARLRTGEQSKFGAFFSDHPRWETRDQREQREYAEALTEFQRRWPDAKLSPGGEPPVVVFVTGKPTVIKDKQLHESHMRVPFSCRNSANPIAVLLTFSHNNRPVHAVDPKYGGKTGELELLRYMPCLENGEMSADLPSITTTEKKMKGSAFFVSSDGTMLETIKNFNVELPK